MAVLRPGDFSGYLADRIPYGPADRRETYGVFSGKELLGALVYYNWHPRAGVWVGGALDKIPFGDRGMVLQLLTLPMGRWGCRTLLAETLPDNDRARRFLEVLGCRHIDTLKSASAFPEGTVIYGESLLVLVNKWMRGK